MTGLKSSSQLSFQREAQNSQPPSFQASTFATTPNWLSNIGIPSYNSSMSLLLFGCGIAFSYFFIHPISPSCTVFSVGCSSRPLRQGWQFPLNGKGEWGITIQAFPVCGGNCSSPSSQLKALEGQPIVLHHAKKCWWFCSSALCVMTVRFPAAVEAQIILFSNSTVHCVSKARASLQLNPLARAGQPSIVLG